MHTSQCIHIAATVMVHQEIQTEPLRLSHKPEVAVEKLATQLEEHMRLSPLCYIFQVPKCNIMLDTATV